MKKYLLLFCLFLGTMTISCHCTNQDFEEFEGEFHDNTKANSSKIEKRKETHNDDTKSIVDLERASTPLEKQSSSIIGDPETNNKVQSIILKRKGYTLSYNKETKCPNWVTWYLSADHSDGEWARSNNYREDYDVPSPRATNDDYKGSLWSRGHMCPAGDNKWDADAMSETFLLSNMCPQDRSLNSGFWNQIEMDCRKWANKYGGVYIVCGPLYYKKEHETIGINQIVIPEAFYKVILRLNPHPKAIGYIVKNNEGKKKKDQYVNTVDEVERISGIDFFPALPDDIEDEVEAHANLDDWR